MSSIYRSIGCPTGLASHQTSSPISHPQPHAYTLGRVKNQLSSHMHPKRSTNTDTKIMHHHHSQPPSTYISQERVPEFPHSLTLSTLPPLSALNSPGLTFLNQFTIETAGFKVIPHLQNSNEFLLPIDILLSLL